MPTWDLLAFVVVVVVARELVDVSLERFDELFEEFASERAC